MLKSIEDNRRELKTKVPSDRENDEQLKQKQKSLQQLEENLEQMEDPATLRERMNQVNAEVIRLKEKRDEIQGPLEETRTHRQECMHQRQSVVTVLRKLTNTMEQQYQHIKRIDEVRLNEKNDRQNLFKAFQWVQSNKSRFKHAVYGPILNEVQFKERLHAQWFENTTSRNVLTSFVVECSEDYDFLLSELREKQGIPINCMLADVRIVRENESQDQIIIRPMWSERRMKEMHFTNTLMNLVEGPEAVRRALYKYTAFRFIVTEDYNWSPPLQLNRLDESDSDNDNNLIVMTPHSQ